MTDYGIGSDRIPSLHRDFTHRVVDGETIVWSPTQASPAVLDGVSAVMLDVIDGTASIGQLAREVHEEVGVPLDLAIAQVARTVATFDHLGLLDDAQQRPPVAEPFGRTPFLGPLTH